MAVAKQNNRPAYFQRQLGILGTSYVSQRVRDFWAPAIWAPAVSIECWWKRDERKNHNLT